MAVVDGAVGGDGAVVGTMIHGLFENAAIRTSMLAHLRARRGLVHASGAAIPPKQAEYDRLAATVRHHLDLELLWRLAGVRG